MKTIMLTDQSYDVLLKVLKQEQRDRWQRFRADQENPYHMAAYHSLSKVINEIVLNTETSRV